MPADRLQKILARAGHGSRRSAERLIAASRVTVDGAPATLGMRADASTQRIAVDGIAIEAPQGDVTLMLNKPRGYLVSAGDDRGRRTIYALLPGAPPHLRYAGRLDRDTEGLLLLSTDGELVHRLAHPRHEVEKVYEATVEGSPTNAALDRLRAGIELDDGPAAPALVERISADGPARIRIVLHEGRNRQVRRMLAAIGHPATALRRTSVGPLELGGLARGASRPLTDGELDQLRRLVGLAERSGLSGGRSD